MKTMQARRLFWERHVNDWRASALSRVAYCQQHELWPIGSSVIDVGAGPMALVPVVVQSEPTADGRCCSIAAAGS